MRWPVAVGAVAVLVGLAGVVPLSLAAPAAPPGPAPSSGVSPSAPPPPQDDANDSPAVPPGASEEGIENATRLVDAHRAVLQNTSYSEHATWADLGRTAPANGSVPTFVVRTYTVAVESGANGSEFHISGPNESSTYWFTDGATMTNHSSQANEQTTTLYEYTRGPAADTRPDRALLAFSSSLIRPYLRDLEYDLVNTTTRENRTLFTYVATGINETVEPNIGDTPVISTTENITATVVVSDRGVIHSFTAHETHASENETVTIEHHYSVDDLGATTVVAPAWTTEELAQFNASPIENGSIVALRHIGGRAVSDPGVFFHTPTSSTTTTVNGTVESGDTLYLYLTTTEDANQTLRTSLNDKPAVNSSFVRHPGENLSVVAWRQTAGDYDSGINLEVTVHEPAPNATGTAPVTRCRAGCGYRGSVKGPVPAARNR